MYSRRRQEQEGVGWGRGGENFEYFGNGMVDAEDRRMYSLHF